MKIQRAELYPMPIRLKEPFVISLGRFDFAENVVVVLHTDAGLTGFGECSPFPSINGENMDTCLVVGRLLATALIGQNPEQLETCTMLLERVIYGNSSIRSAFDMALYDLASQCADLPLYSFLGAIKDKELVTDYTVSLGDKEKMASDALRIKEAGFQVIKVKLGETAEKDVERLRLIRDSIGYDIPVRIDANQGWDMGNAITALNAMAPLNVQHCEEPLPRWNFMELSSIRRHCRVPIMADESCCDHHDARRLIDLKACDLFNVKLGKSGGIFNALKILKLAKEAGIKVQVGGFLESRLGFTAAAHLALAGTQVMYCDFDSPLMFVEDPVVGGIEYDQKGVVTLPCKIGLGASIHQDYLRHLDKIEVKS